MVERLWNRLPASQGRTQGSKTISIELTFPFLQELLPPPPPAPTTLPKAMSRLSWITTVKYYSVQFPIWPWLARIKLCMYFVWHRFYIVMMSYAKRKKN